MTNPRVAHYNEIHLVKPDNVALLAGLGHNIPAYMCMHYMHTCACVQVYEEYSILKSLYGRNGNPVPEPLHCSSEAERRDVGTKFIIMSFVEVSGNLLVKYS